VPLVPADSIPVPLDSTGTARPDSSAADTLFAPQITGSSFPPVTPADLDNLKKEGLIIPVAGVQPKDLVNSFDDMRGTTRRHNALDIMAARNTPVLAAVTGRVLKIHNSVAGGLTIYMSDPTSRFVMMYGHLNSFRDGIKEGQAVKQGEIIGFVGSTGNANPLAPHLHFQVTRNDNMKEWWKGTPLNPFLVFRPTG
jgi:murein DD-endopeptidase MepM/ murein hydrolase activator NlpD